MFDSLFATTSGVGAGSGGGIVSYNIVKALKECSDLKLILCNGTSDLARSININPSSWGLVDNPFLYDYLASQLVVKVDLAHFRGDPFGVTVDKLRKLNKDVKIVVDVPAHNLEVSVEEFYRLGLEYPFKHMIDRKLWKIYIKHVIDADVIITPSTLSKEYITNSDKFVGFKGEIKVIPHGCDLPERVVYINEDAVGYMGALGPDKGFIYLLHAIKNLDVKLFIAGSQSSYIRVNDPDVDKKIFRLGYVKDVSEFYNNINVYVQPSVTEGFGIEVLEAMSYGRPVIVTQGTGAKDLVEDGKNGFIVPIRDSKAIAEKIQYFIDNPSEIIRMGHNARLTAEKYTWDVIREKYIDVYRELGL